MNSSSEKPGKPSRTVFTVSRLNQDVNGLLESQFGMLWVEGELSNFSRPGSGHFYFSLKDSRSQLRCAMFRGRNRYINFTPEDGQRVLLRGKLGIYEARGDFQFIAEHMEPAGEGLLQQQFEETKKRLQAAGWFDQLHKQPLPALPESIGVITSPTGAAVRDVLNVLSRRFPYASVIVYPTMVQGSASAPQICQAIRTANARAETDVLILCRGGGSIEDLWGFNDETVAKAVYDSQIPLVSGVGHEVDFTIADLVADVRAPTPSAAAELVVPETTELTQNLERTIETMRRALVHQLAPVNTLLAQLINRLQIRHPQAVVAQQFQRTDELEARLLRAFNAIQQSHQNRNSDLTARLNRASPARQIERNMAQINQLEFRLRTATNSSLEAQKSALSNTLRALDAISPLATLARGYSVIRKGPVVIKDYTQVTAGDQVEAMLGAGTLIATVKETVPEQN